MLDNKEDHSHKQPPVCNFHLAELSPQPNVIELARKQSTEANIIVR